MPDGAPLYIATDNGLYFGTLNGTVNDIRVLGLQGEGRVWPVVVDQDDPRRLYVATNRGGVFRSDDGGTTWSEKNRGLLYKETWCILQHPMTGELYVGTGPAAIFKSVDRGDTWTMCEQLHRLPETKEWTFPNAPHIAHVKGLGLDPHDPQRVFAAIEEGWLVRSLDAGATWTTLKNGTEFDAHTVTVMPDDPATLVHASGTGVYRSEDGGDTFHPANDGLTKRYVSQVVVHPAEPNVLYTAASEVPPFFWRRPEGANSGFFRSSDQGRHWEPLTNGVPAGMKQAPRSTGSDPGAVGSFLVGMSDGTIFSSRDRGDSFKLVAGGLPGVYGLTVDRR